MTFPNFSQSHPAREPSSARQNSQSGGVDELSLTLNTAFVRARTNDRCAGRDLAAELSRVSATPAANAILSAVRLLAQEQNLPELEAAEQVVRTFRKLDEIWGTYLCQEGLARITSAE